MGGNNLKRGNIYKKRGEGFGGIWIEEEARLKEKGR